VTKSIFFNKSKASIVGFILSAILGITTLIYLLYKMLEIFSDMRSDKYVLFFFGWIMVGLWIIATVIVVASIIINWFAFKTNKLLLIIINIILLFTTWFIFSTLIQIGQTSDYNTNITGWITRLLLVAIVSQIIGYFNQKKIIKLANIEVVVGTKIKAKNIFSIIGKVSLVILILSIFLMKGIQPVMHGALLVVIVYDYIRNKKQ